MKDNSGSAFPQHGDTFEEGMTLRDYFAAHCDQPGQVEMAENLGWEIDDRGVVVDFTKKYAAISQDKRLAAYSKVRYQMADAMLEERKK